MCIKYVYPLLCSAAPPVILAPQNYTVIEGSDVVITFDLLGHPSAHTLHYFLDGVELNLQTSSSSDRVTLIAGREGSLQISNVKRTDEGTYSLHAQNSIGEDTAYTQLIVLCRYPWSTM